MDDGRREHGVGTSSYSSYHTNGFFFFVVAPRSQIMRRVLRKIIAQQTDQLGDLSTLADPSVVTELIAKVNKALAAGAK